jgi:P3 major capsid protein
MLTRQQRINHEHALARQHAAQQRIDGRTARNLVLRGGHHAPSGKMVRPGVNMWQALALQLPASLTPGTTIAINFRNIGLVKRVLVKVSGTLTAPAANNMALTKLGLANFFSTVSFQDMAGVNRIMTLMPHLIYLSALKRRQVWGASYVTDTPFGMSNNNTSLNTVPSTIAGGATVPFSFMLEIPMSVSDEDLRGAIWAGVTQAQMQIQLTINPNLGVATGLDPTLSVFSSSGASPVTLASMSIQVYQNYMDQLPTGANQEPILPHDDLSVSYMLNNTASVLPIANSDLFAPFVNGRSYLSAFMIYDNAGTLTVDGLDVNYVQIVAANLTPIVKVDPQTAFQMVREQLGTDLPAGIYYFDLRRRPINTDVYGNMQLGLNPSAVGGSTAYVLYFWEALARVGQVAEMGSMPSA